LTNSNGFETLSEQDLSDILAFNRQLLRCHQRSELNALIGERLLPLLQSKACIYFFTEPNLSKFQISEAINVPEETLAFLPHLFASEPMVPTFLSGHRSVLAYDVDLDRSLSRKAMDQFFLDNPQFESQRSIYVDSVSAGMAAINLPNANVGLVVHRWRSEDIPFTVRDVRILELLWPSIAQTIRSIFLSEELSRYRSFADSLADIDSPIALINEQGKRVYHNRAYEALFPDYAFNAWLPDELLDMTRGEIERFGEEAFQGEPIKMPFLLLGKNAYRFSVARIEVEDSDEAIWMLRLDLTVDDYSRFIQQLQERGLSPKELEVCLLMKDGLAPRKVAERLCVSYYTVRSHLRNIYLKLGINTQVQLITYLNRECDA
jgi:DNA-binding CsgD family transcriptional regulator/PAS domain-containing protein